MDRRSTVLGVVVTTVLALLVGKLSTSKFPCRRTDLREKGQKRSTVSETVDSFSLPPLRNMYRPKRLIYPLGQGAKKLSTTLKTVDQPLRQSPRSQSPQVNSERSTVSG